VPGKVIAGQPRRIGRMANKKGLEAVDHRFGRSVTLATLLLLAAQVAGAQALVNPETSEPSPVLLITVDTLRADRLGCYGARTVRTPAIDALASQGVRFENALAQVPITLPSHAVILTGTYPMWNGVRDFTSPGLPPSVGLLAEAFRRHGYDTAAFVSAFVLDSSWGFSRGFQTYDDHFDPRQFETRNPGNIERRAEETVGRLLAWFQARGERGSAARPFFVWLHLYDPHSPYDPPEPFHSQYAGHLYDGEVAYVDSQLARLFGELRKSGLYDKTLIVLLSDHGESLGEHGEDEHGFFVYDSTLHVPLIFKLPRGTGSPRVVPQPVATVDVAPTLLDFAHLRDALARQFQGSSLVSALLGKGSVPDRPVYSETYYPHDSFGWSELRALTTRRYHYIEAPRAELYDWTADPKEERNLFAPQRTLASALRAQLTELERRYTPSTPIQAPSGPALSPDTVEKLKSLGYLAYSAPAPPASSGTLPDPKDRLRTFKTILKAEDLSSLGRLDESSRLLRTLAREEPGLYLIPFMLAENAAKARQWSEAEARFLACLKLNPTFEQAMMGLARAYVAYRKGPQAQPWLELALHQNPHNFLAYYALGLVALEQGRKDEALRSFSRSVEEKSSYAPSQQALGVLLAEMQRYQEGLPHLRRAAELGPLNPVLANYLGIVCANTQDLPAAIDYYRQALALKPDYAGARLNLAFAYLKLARREDATREFRALCKQSAALCQQYRTVFE